MAEQKEIHRINSVISAITPGQIAVEPTVDADLGYIMWGGRDYSGDATKWLAKNKPGSLETIRLIGSSTTGDEGLLRHDDLGNVTGGPITLEDLNDLISDAELQEALWARHEANGYLYPLTPGDTIITGDGDKDQPAVGFDSGNNYGLYYDDTKTRIKITLGGNDSWMFDRVGSVHQFIIGDDSTSPTERYAHLRWDENDYEDRSYFDIEQYRGSDAPGAEGIMRIRNRIYDGSYSAMYVYNFHPSSSFLYLEAAGSASTLVDIKAAGAVGEIKHTAGKVTVYGQLQVNPADAAATPDYSFVGHVNSGMRYETSDDSIRFGLGGVDMLQMIDTAGLQYSLKTLNNRRYFGIYHDLSTGTERPELSIVVNGTGTAVGSHMTLQASSAADAGTPSLIDISATGGYSYIYIDSIASGDTKNAETRIGSTAGGASAVASVFGRSDSSNAGHAGALNLYAENRGTGKAQVWIGTDVHLGSGTGEIYIGTNGSYFTNSIFFTDANRTGWTGWGPKLSDGASAWTAYKANWGEVGLMDAINAAGIVSPASTFTPDSIIFADSDGKLTSNPTRLNYDDDGFNITSLNTGGSATGYLGVDGSTTAQLNIDATAGGGNDADIDIQAYSATTGTSQIDITAVSTTNTNNSVLMSAQGTYTATMRVQSDGSAYIYGESDVTFNDGNRSGSTWSSIGIPLSAGSSEWSAIETLIGSEGSVFAAIIAAGQIGSIVAQNAAETATSTTSGSYVQRLRCTTPSLTSGVGYIILWNMEIQAVADNEVQARVQLNDTTDIAEPYYDNDPYATRGISTAGCYYSNTLSGVYNIDIDWRNAYGGGSVWCGRARIMVLRVS